jgi:hypothetical protein
MVVELPLADAPLADAPLADGHLGGTPHGEAPHGVASQRETPPTGAMQGESPAADSSGDMEGVAARAREDE